MRRVLLTGASGFIGRHALEPLVEQGFEVHAVYHDHPLEHPGVIWHKADLLDKAAAAGLCAELRATHLLHLAWYVDPKDYKTSPENARWADATLALVRAFRESGGTRATLAGTCMEYDWTVSQETLSEDASPIWPATPYGIAKHETHLACEEYAKENGLSLAWGRIFFLYGPHEAQARLVPLAIHSLLEAKAPRITAGGLVRDYSYVGDIAGAFAVLVDSNVTGAVNIASGTPTTLKDIVVSIAQMVGKPEVAEAIPEVIPDGEPARIVADVSRLREEVGWTSRYDLRKGLEETIEWWKEA